MQSEQPGNSQLTPPAAAGTPLFEKKRGEIHDTKSSYFQINLFFFYMRMFGQWNENKAIFKSIYFYTTMFMNFAT